MTPMKSFRRDTNYLSVTPKPKPTSDIAAKPSTTNLTRRRSLSDYRSTLTAPPSSTALKSANKMGNGLSLGTTLSKFAQSKLVKIKNQWNRRKNQNCFHFYFHRQKSVSANRNRLLVSYAAKKILIQND